MIIYDSLTGKVEEFVHGHKACVRDVYWHPYRNEIITTSWDGRIGRWTYRDKTSARDNEPERRSQNSTNGPKFQPPQTPLRRSSRIASKKRSTRAD
ncbi:hypothetical protein Zmor_023544 [Zophobas morio]|uniref:Uncharacterized protein n=3 Tax=Zophobas morio TaxID=2755281 RepID=A0AA38HXI3_9CUCU|nr:hypothetical protein Zmor_023544 [Zophobas morio]